MDCHDRFKLSEMPYIALKIVSWSKRVYEFIFDYMDYNTLLEQVLSPK